MSILSKVLKKIGGVAKFVAPFIPGIGPLAAAGIGAGGALLSKGKKSKLGDVLGGAAVGGLGKFAMGKIGGAPGAPGAVPGMGGPTGQLLSQFGGAPGAAPGGLAGLLGKLGLNNPGGGANIGKIAGIGLAGAGILSGAKQQGQANEINQQVLGQLQGQQANRGQLQEEVMRRLMQQQGGSNPYAQQYGRVG